jgi:beta-glucosidase/6-phospho-beta-glucosidase/beta-galactosidase
VRHKSGIGKRIAKQEILSASTHQGLCHGVRPVCPPSFAPINVPGIAGGARGQYTCGHNLLLAHAAAVRLYAARGSTAQRGRVGMALSMMWAEPLTSSQADCAAAQRYLDDAIGWFADVLYRGDYPASLKATQPALPVFTEAQRKAFLAHPPDFLGVNFYTATFAASDGTPYGYTLSAQDKQGQPIGPRAQSSWLYVTPWAFQKLLAYLDARYSAPAIFVSENGVSVPGEAGMTAAAAARDGFRLDYYSSYLDSLCSAVAQGVCLLVGAARLQAENRGRSFEGRGRQQQSMHGGWLRSCCQRLILPRCM